MYARQPWLLGVSVASCWRRQIGVKETRGARETDRDVVNCESDPGILGSLSVSSYSPYSMRAIHYILPGPLITGQGEMAVREPAQEHERQLPQQACGGSCDAASEQKAGQVRYC